jgi:hypothetical protein
MPSGSAAFRSPPAVSAGTTSTLALEDARDREDVPDVVVNQDNAGEHRVRAKAPSFREHP